MILRFIAIFCIVFFIIGCKCDRDTSRAFTPYPDLNIAERSERQLQGFSRLDDSQFVYHQYGQPVTGIVIHAAKSFSPLVLKRIYNLLKQVTSKRLLLYKGSQPLLSPGAGGRVISLGQNATTRAVISTRQLNNLPSEGFLIRTTRRGQGIIAVAVGNKDLKKNVHKNPHVIGDYFAAYALLEELGFAFLHPLEATLPAKLNFKLGLNITEKPHWPIRMWHIHTQHPLELTHVLNGWGEKGPEDYEGWLRLLHEWQLFLEWAIANRQNRVEWFLLMASSWQRFADSPERQARLRTLVSLANQWGLAAGIDAPIAFKQQHAFTMLREKGNETRQIRQKIDWLMQCGFDYLEIEMGFSEFTHPEDRLMLKWMNEVTRYADEKYGKRTYVKVHVSQGQEAANFKNPDSGKPLNFNFLPHYADKRLGVLPHTVQHYSVDDPALTYGNKDFSAILSFMRWTAGSREVIWYPETAYWVSFDIDVPLFLPLYADRRLYDLRKIAKLEQAGSLGLGSHRGSRIDGQVNFSSGWEWGYWLNDVITARAAWHRPDLSLAQDQAFTQSLKRVFKVFGAAQGELAETIADLARKQHDLFILGKVGGKAPKTVLKRTAQAYLQGSEAWDDMGKLFGQLPIQPVKKGLVDMRNPAYDTVSGGPAYDSELKYLLAETESELKNFSTRIDALEVKVPENAKALYYDLRDSLEMTYLRARQVHHLYGAVNEVMDNSIKPLSKGEAQKKLEIARSALDTALALSQKREKSFRVNAERIAGWNYNPTAYHFGYLWTTRTLYYWWRDEGKAVDAPKSPCYLNILDPFDIANGEGEWSVDIHIMGTLSLDGLKKVANTVLGSRGFLTNCMNEPESEPTFPQNGLRGRSFE